jgi:hypothetical protein
MSRIRVAVDRREMGRLPAIPPRCAHSLLIQERTGAALWRQLHRTGPPQGLSRDLLIRALANQLQEWIHGRASGALRRRLQALAGEFDRNGASFDPGVVLKTGTTLVRQWRGHAHSVLVREDGFEYQGQRYRWLCHGNRRAIRRGVRADQVSRCYDGF